MNRSERGFTLIEMAIVVVIAGLLFGGMMMGVSAHQQQMRISQTQAQLAQARDALLGFLASQGRLPCPAEPAVASGTAGAGIERAPTAGGCTGGLAGVLPWATLQLPETDAWGRRLAYRVTGTLANSFTAPPNAAFSLVDTGDITIADDAGQPIATGTPAVIVSHGANGAGGWNSRGVQLPASANVQEQENHDGDAAFVERTPTTTWDDLVVWVPLPILMNRAIQSGRLP